MKLSPHSAAILSLVGAALLWSTGGFFIKSLDMQPLAIAGMRSAIAAVVMLLWLRKPRPVWSLAQIGGIVSYALTVVLFVLATKRTSAANAILLQYTAPVWVALLSGFLTRERPGKLDIAMVGVVIIGMAVFFLDKIEAGHVEGNILAVLSGVAFAGVALFTRAQRGVSTVETILFGNILAAVVCLPLAGPIAFGFDVTWRLAVLGVFQLGISYILYARAMAHVTALEAVLFTMLEPLLNPVWVALLTSERPSLMSVFGGLLVITGVVIRQVLDIRIKRTSITP